MKKNDVFCLKYFFAAAVAAIVLSPLLVFVSCQSAEAQTADVSYDMSVTVDGAENKVSVDMTVNVANTFKDGLDRLVFAFYPDAFTLKNPPPVDATMMSAAYPYGINAGGYSFLQADGDNVKSVSLCETPCRIVAYLNKPLTYGESTVVRFSYDLTLPLCNARYGYNDFSINLTYFFPVLCRFDKDADDFLFYDYVATGDPFVFNVADYSLSLYCPSDWQVACSAPLTSDNRGKKTFSATSLRDLSLFLAPEAVTDTLSSCGYTVNVIHDGSFSHAAQYAANALATFSQAFCELPSKNYCVVFTPFMTAGAEFCNVAMLSSSLPFAEVEKVVAHEVAHQWWYSLVGSDQVSAPWQDEALAQWSTLLYFEKRDMKSYADTLLKNMSDVYRDYTLAQRALGEDALCNVFRSTTDYRDYTDYYVTVYCKAALAINVSAESVTTDSFCKALSLYAKRNGLTVADAQELFTSLDLYDSGLGGMLKSSLSASVY